MFTLLLIWAVVAVLVLSLVFDKREDGCASDEVTKLDERLIKAKAYIKSRNNICKM